MTATANWSYTAEATIWRSLGTDEWNKPSFATPITIACDYGGDSKRGNADVGREFVVKDTVWTEYAEAKEGDYLLIGVSAVANPIDAGADEIKHIIRYADTFDRVADDYALITGV
ncbi:hypothetical protein [Hafnia sp. CBA7124]|uniref:hypothetical protein n=1 Tax=Hafnia sp. CBA7124 TaxID=1848580 RepID=UPI000BBB2554|nr:hypothetical protein [Hafnia sp. CBA7124]